jgi:hypothetical protein
MLVEWLQTCGDVPLTILADTAQSDALIRSVDGDRAQNIRIEHAATLEERLGFVEEEAVLYSDRPPNGLFQTLPVFSRARVGEIEAFIAESVADQLAARGKVSVPEGPEGIQAIGHREYVGGWWDEIGRLQFDFLVSVGLRPDDILLDIACGSLRGGRHFIPYLDRGHYLGIDRESVLIQAGIRHELGLDTYAERQPEFVVSSSFEFERFTRQPTVAIAQSLFSHFALPEIELCLERLRPNVSSGHRFFATFFTGREGYENPEASHSHLVFYHPPEAVAALGAPHGWEAEYIGDWGHPRGQVMMRFSAV